MKIIIGVLLSFCITHTLYSQDANTQTEDNNLTAGICKNLTVYDSIVDYAKSYIGIKYKYAGCTPETGFDCSGFLNYVFKKFGKKLPRSSRDYKDFGKKISLKKCKKGDIILFSGRNPKQNPVGHVGIIISTTENGIKFIHSATSNNRGIVISDFSVKYYKTRFAGIRRVFF